MSDTVTRLDRSALIDRMKDALALDPARAVAITIDMQRGAFDTRIGTLPLPPDEVRRVLDGTRELLPALRAAGVRVIHVSSQWYRFERDSTHPFVLALNEAKLSLTPHARSNMKDHKIVGSPEAELIAELGVEPGDLLVDSKRRFDSFYGTNLEVLLRVIGADTVILLGANTNTCVLCTAFAAYCRDLKVVVAADCVATAYGPDLHEFALDNVRRRLGWVLTNGELMEKLGARVLA
ncbi:MAG: cysteine hydrolase [Burkholderiales bacterium]|nr:cysteine hydrolase [Burkholderiales bacterium]